MAQIKARDFYRFSATLIQKCLGMPKNSKVFTFYSWVHVLFLYLCAKTCPLFFTRWKGSQGYRINPVFCYKLNHDLKIIWILIVAWGSMNWIIILITDGKRNLETDLMDPVKALQSLFNAGVKIFALGVECQVNKRKLEYITGVKNRSYYDNTFYAILQK